MNDEISHLATGTRCTQICASFAAAVIFCIPTLELEIVISSSKEQVLYHFITGLVLNGRSSRNVAKL